MAKPFERNHEGLFSLMGGMGIVDVMGLMNDSPIVCLAMSPGALYDVLFLGGTVGCLSFLMEIRWVKGTFWGIL